MASLAARRRLMRTVLLTIHPRLVEFIVQKQTDVITKNKERIAEIRAKLAKFDRPQRPD